MTKIKLCGLSRPCDIDAANELQPDYIGFVFAQKSSRCIAPAQAADLKARLLPTIQAVGVFVNEAPETVASLLNDRVIDMAQLHGSEDEETIRRLRDLTDRPLIQAFWVRSSDDIARAGASTADEILLDAGAGCGTSFNWLLLKDAARRYFLAGGLNPQNVREAIRGFRPYAVDVSSGIETDGRKDPVKMADFVAAVREEEET